MSTRCAPAVTLVDTNWRFTVRTVRATARVAYLRTGA